MTQSKGSFTPGPWEVEQSARDGATIRTSGRAPVWYIADIAGCLPGGPKETLANARLIAAAPALLEIAREALRVAEGDVEDRRGVIEANDDYEPDDAVLAALIIRRDRIAAAIQSATGEG